MKMTFSGSVGSRLVTWHIGFWLASMIWRIVGGYTQLVIVAKYAVCVFKNSTSNTAAELIQLIGLECPEHYILPKKSKIPRLYPVRVCFY